MKALIDGDILLYRVGFASEAETERIAIARMRDEIQRIKSEAKCQEYEVFISSDKREENFRYDLYPEYKGNRKAGRPIHYNALRNYLITKEKAHVSIGEEADDALAMRQTDETVICSIDKDLLQVPGLHYRFVDKRMLEINQEEARYNFYIQLLTGDKPVDNIPGIDGVGIKTAEKILEGCVFEEGFKEAVLQAYKEHFIYCNEDEIRAHINLIGKLLWLKRHPNDVWEF